MRSASSQEEVIYPSMCLVFSFRSRLCSGSCIALSAVQGAALGKALVFGGKSRQILR